MVVNSPSLAFSAVSVLAAARRISVRSQNVLAIVLFSWSKKVNSHDD
jgi:hypothetical protein